MRPVSSTPKAPPVAKAHSGVDSSLVDALTLVAAIVLCLALAFFLFSCSCPKSPGAVPPPPIPQDATTVDGAAYTPCDMACARYRELRCPEGDDTAADESGQRHRCEEVCQNAATHGIDLAGAVACTSTAADCAAVRSCSK